MVGHCERDGFTNQHMLSSGALYQQQKKTISSRKKTKEKKESYLQIHSLLFHENNIDAK